METASDRNGAPNTHGPAKRGSGALALLRGRRFSASSPFEASREGWRDRLGAFLAEQVEVETRARSGFHLVPVGLIVGVALVYGGDWRPNLLAVAVVAVLLLGLAACLGHRAISKAFVIFAAFAALGGALALWEISQTDTIVFSGEATVHIGGTVLSRERDERGRTRYLVAIDRTERPTLSRPPGRARIVVGSRHEPLGIGARYEGLVRLRPPSGPAYPGAYDFAFSPFFSGLGAYGFSLGAPERVASAQADRAGLFLRFKRQIAERRLAMTERIREAIDGPPGAVAAALITGERDAIPQDVQDWLRATGLAHVLSISGLHLAIVTSFAMLLVRLAISLVPAIALRIPAKKVAAVAAIGVATLYLGLSGANIATQRAYVMLVIMLAAIVLDRPALTLRNVSIAAIVVILLTPHAVMTASFQMSFAATVALIAGYARLAAYSSSRRERRASFARRSIMALAGIALTSLIAGSATGPFAAYHFQRLAAFGFVANVLTMPIFTLWIMPLALVGSLLMPLGLEGIPYELMGAGISVVLKVAHALYDRLPDLAIGEVTAGGLVLMTAAILSAACFASRLRWVSVPLLVAGLFLAADRSPPPSLLVFEDGKEIAVLRPDREIAYLKVHPNDFVAAQWERGFATRPWSPAAAPDGSARAAETGEIASNSASAKKTSVELARAGPPGKESRSPNRARIPAECRDDFCRFSTPDGLRVVWTSDYKKTGKACDTADVAIVARAIRLRTCRSGAELVTLRTLRRTGSLAIRRSPVTGRALIERSVSGDPAKWNRHRLAPWPEFWRKPTSNRTSTSTSTSTSDAARENQPMPAKKHKEAVSATSTGPQDAKEP